MSAIFGTIHLDGHPADLRQLHSTGELLAHRGPDGVGHWLSGGAAMGHRLLRTTPEAQAGQQPFVCRRTGRVIVADARIDNRHELIGSLGANSTTEAPLSDGELILRAYERWGAECPTRLLGDFAFAIWDPRSRELFCARDPLGVRSLYYHHIPARSFTFATEIKGVIHQPHVPRRTDDGFICEYLTEGFSASTRTIYSQVLKLAPAHSLTVSPAGVRSTRYWTLDTGSPLRLGSDAEYAEAFREVFTDAVRVRLRGPDRIGTLLSGGLDSSSITACADEELRGSADRKLHTFSLVFPNLGEDDRRRIDERPFIRAVLDRVTVEPHFVEGDRLDPLACLKGSLSSQDQPVFAPNLYLHEGIYAEAKAADIRVLLDGVDGDTVVSHGWEHLTELALGGRWRRLGSETRAIARRYGVSTRHLLVHRVAANLLPEEMSRAFESVMGRSAGMSDQRTLVNKGLLAKARDSRRHHDPAVRPIPSRRGGGAAKAHAAGIESGLTTYMVEVADKSAASFGIEPRYPFLDRRVVQFCVSLPAGQKLRDGWHRFILRQAMAPLLPERVAWRTCKGNLSSSFCRGFLSDHPERLERELARHSGALSRFVDLKSAEQMLTRYRQAPIAGNAEAMNLYHALLLGEWLESGDGVSRGESPDRARIANAALAQPCAP